MWWVRLHFYSHSFSIPAPVCLSVCSVSYLKMTFDASLLRQIFQIHVNVHVMSWFFFYTLEDSLSDRPEYQNFFEEINILVTLIATPTKTHNFLND